MNASKEYSQIAIELEELKKQSEEQKRQIEMDVEKRRLALLEPAKKRIAEIQEIRRQLDDEESKLQAILGEKKTKIRRKGRRMTARHKAEVVSRFISQGHIRSNMDFTKELRTALLDEGFTTNDFRKMNDYLPKGWEARSNGQRGTGARTTFHAG